MRITAIAASVFLALGLGFSLASAQEAPSRTGAASENFVFPEQPRDVRLVKQPEVERMLRTHGADLLVVNFWATTCAPCVKEMPYFETTWKDFKDEGVIFVGLTTDYFVFDDWEPRVVRLLERLDITYPNFAVDVDAQKFIPFFAEEWGGEQPATFFYNKQGEQVHKVLGEISEADLRAAVAALKDGKPVPAQGDKTAG